MLIVLLLSKWTGFDKRNDLIPLEVKKYSGPTLPPVDSGAADDGGDTTATEQGAAIVVQNTATAAGDPHFKTFGLVLL